MEINALPERPWVEVGSDLFEWRNQTYLLTVDYYSKWIEVEELPSQTSFHVIKMLEKIFARFGIPEVLRTDNGPCYKSESFSAFVESWGVVHKTSSPRYPESNGMAVRSVKTVKDLLRKENSLEDVLLAYRATPLASGFSPAQLMFGRRIRSKLGLHVDQETDYPSFERLNESAKALSKKKWDSKHRALPLPQLTVGSRVWVNAPQNRGSEGEVVQKDNSPHSFWVRVGPSLLRRDRKHLALLPEQVSSGVIRDEYPKRELTPKTGYRNRV